MKILIYKLGHTSLRCDDDSNECEHVEVATIDGRMYGVATHALSMDACIYELIDGWMDVCIGLVKMWTCTINVSKYSCGR